MNSSGVDPTPSVTGKTSTGIYQINFTQPIAKCAQAITVRGSTPAFAVGGTASQTQVNLVIFKSDGTLMDAPFDLTVTC